MRVEVTEIRPEVVLSQWVRILYVTWIELGLRDVVICPGSRSTPLAWGALMRQELRCHSVLDERSAAFFALGLAKSTARPVALLCTSGSAGAHFLPAIIEAYHSEVPLLAVTADRPSRLQDCSAPQTIDQVGLFGGYAKRIAGWDECSDKQDTLVAFRRKITGAFYDSKAPAAQPVHLNFPVDKPLESLDPSSDEEREFVRRVDSLLAAPKTKILHAEQADSGELSKFLDEFLEACGPAFLSIGPVSHDVAVKARALADVLGLPLLSEFAQAGPASPLDNIALRLQRNMESTFSINPTRLLHIGPPFVSSACADAIDQNLVTQWVICGRNYSDPSQRAAQCVVGDMSGILNQLIEIAKSLLPQEPRAQAALFEPEVESIKRALAKSSADVERLSEPLSVYTALSACAAQSHVVLANSMSVRLAAWVSSLTPSPLSLFFCRGANGIDGAIAHASGIALGKQTPTLLILGDVTAAHDLSSLAVAATIKTPLILFVLDNEGGRIFDHLPVAQMWGEGRSLREFWQTRPQVNWSLAASAYGVAYARPCKQSDLQEMLVQALAHEGTTLIHTPCDSNSTNIFLQTQRETL